jgi:hypothetical protein
VATGLAALRRDGGPFAAGRWSECLGRWSRERPRRLEAKEKVVKWRGPTWYFSKSTVYKRINCVKCKKKHKLNPKDPQIL